MKLSGSDYPQTAVKKALKLLQISQLALIVHDQSFPSLSFEEIGRGSPYSYGALEFYKFISAIGFNTLQLGPQGETYSHDPSPYNSTIYGKSSLSLSLARIIDEYDGLLLDVSTLQQFIHDSYGNNSLNPLRVNYAAIQKLMHKATFHIYHKFIDGSKNVLLREISKKFYLWKHHQFQQKNSWLQRYCLYSILSHLWNNDDWHFWHHKTKIEHIDMNLFTNQKNKTPRCQKRIDQLLHHNESLVDYYSFVHFLLSQQHITLQQDATRLGLLLYADLHIGYSKKDHWGWKHLFLPNYYLGAPPSRTNPEGQPWGYPILNPHYLSNSIQPKNNTIAEGRDFFQDRVMYLLHDYDGLRIDHPHGLVCPWVYKSDTTDPYEALKKGARLYDSPQIEEHLQLSQFAIVREDQISDNKYLARYDDNWVIDCNSSQVNQYANLIDLIISCTEMLGKNKNDILCEILSTCPKPLQAVIETRGLGRFCVTQKADPTQPNHIYRIENTKTCDWAMLGNHDTKPLWLIIHEKWNTSWIRDRAQLLTSNLLPDGEPRDQFYNTIISEKQHFFEAFCAELFSGPAQQVALFFPDFFGMSEVYNIPNTINDTNWSLRIPPDFQNFYDESIQAGRACSLPRILRIALRARKNSIGSEAVGVIKELEGY